MTQINPPPIAHFRHRLILQSPLITPDNQGGLDIIWQDIATVWAAIDYSKVSQKIHAPQGGEQPQYQVWIWLRRPLPGNIILGSDWRFMDDQYHYRLNGIFTHDPPAYWRCDCRAVAR